MLYQIEPRSFPLQELSAYWENFISEEEINWLLSRPEWLKTDDAQVGGQSNEGVVDKKIRRSKINWLDVNRETDFLWKRITDVVANVNSHFFNFDLTGCYEPLQLSVYKENDLGAYEWHTDTSMRDGRVPRKLSMSLLLSNPSDFEGGHLQIKTSNDDAITLEQKRGRAWFFPSYTLHRVTPVTKGIRRSVVLWVGGPAFK